MSSFLNPILTIAPAWAYVVISLLVFAEAAVFVGFVLPGETAVLLGGVMASTNRISLTWLIILVIIAAVVGDSVGYEVGKHFGPRLLHVGPMRKHSGSLDGARKTLRRRGGIAVLLGRWTAFLRAVMPAMAGLSQMPYRTFLIWNATGGIIWGVVVSLAGYFAGQSYAKVETYLGRGSAVALAVVVLLTLFVWHRHRSRADEESAAS